MSKNKSPRLRIELEAKRVREKSFYQCVLSHIREGYGMPPRLAEEITADALSYLSRSPNQRLPEQIRLPLPKGRDNHSRKFASKETNDVLLTPCTFEPDVALLKGQGVRALQNARLIRITREAWLQDAIMTRDLLSKLCNMTRRTVSARLSEMRSLGIRVPTLGETNEERNAECLDYSTVVLRALMEGQPTSEIHRRYFTTPAMVDSFLHNLREVRHYAERGCEPTKIAEATGQQADLVNEYLDIIEQHRGEKHFELLAPKELLREPIDPGLSDMMRFEETLQREYGLSRGEATLLHHDLVVLFGPDANSKRGAGQVIFHATKSTEPAGKPLSGCELVPVVLDFFTNKDRKAKEVETLKLDKLQRYAEQAKAQGAYLTHADLGYLLGVSTSVVARLQELQLSSKIIPFPTRGREADIGRAITHRTRIIDLWMQIYTETEIVRRTGHTYQSVENYIAAFGRFALLKDKMLPLPVIRKALGCSMKLVEAYDELYKKYNTEDYWYRFELLRARVLRDDSPLERAESSEQEAEKKTIHLARKED